MRIKKKLPPGCKASVALPAEAAFSALIDLLRDRTHRHRFHKSVSATSPHITQRKRAIPLFVRKTVATGSNHSSGSNISYFYKIFIGNIKHRVCSRRPGRRPRIQASHRGAQ